MIKPSAAFNLTQIIESLDVSASSVSENSLKNGVGGEGFSIALTTAIEQVQQNNVGTEAATLDKYGNNLPLSSLSKQNTKEELARDMEKISLQNIAKSDETITPEIQLKNGASDQQAPVSDKEIRAEFKLQTVRFMNGRKVLTSIVDQGDFPEIAENYSGDLYEIDDDIEKNNPLSVEGKSPPQVSQLRSLPLWWQKQSMQSVDHDKDISLAGKMAVAHGKQANIHAVTANELAQRSDQIASNRSKYQEDTLDPNISDISDVNGAKNEMTLSQQQMNKLHESIGESQEVLEMADDVSSARSIRVLPKNNLDQQAILKLSTALNGTNSKASIDEGLDHQAIQNIIEAINNTSVDNNTSIVSNLGAQVIKNSGTAINMMSENKTIAEQVERISQLPQTESNAIPFQINQKKSAASLLEEKIDSTMPRNIDSVYSEKLSINNGMNKGIDFVKPTATITSENSGQSTSLTTTLGMTQHQTSEVGVQTQGNNTSFYTNGITRPQIGEQLINLVSKEIDVPQQDGVNSLRIEITPPELGDLEIELRKQGKELEVMILASTEEAANAIKDQSSILKNILSNQDFSRVQVNVDIGKREHSSQQEQGDSTQGDPEKPNKQRFLKVRFHDGVIDTLV